MDSSFGSAPQIAWQTATKIARPSALGISARIQSSSVILSHVRASLAFHGATTPTRLAGASSFSDARIACCTSGLLGKPGTAS